MAYSVILSIAFLFLHAKANEFSNEEKQEILDWHNNYRAQVARNEVDGQPGSSNMILMQWDDQAEARAQTMVNRCVFQHDSARDRRYPPFRWVGQNVAYGRSDLDGKRSVTMWFNEYKQYSFDTKQCSGVCGHYTQVVWAKTSLIGCAKSICPNNRALVACDYATGGNFNRQKPYYKGYQCSECPSEYDKCMVGLCAKQSQCDNSGYSCSNSTTSNNVIQEGQPQNNANIIPRVTIGNQPIQPQNSIPEKLNGSLKKNYAVIRKNQMAMRKKQKEI